MGEGGRGEELVGGGGKTLPTIVSDIGGMCYIGEEGGS